MIKSQADQRRAMTLTDNHGRKWHANIEKASGAPCGVVMPQFDVPHPDLVPPQKYLRFPVDEPGRVYIEYAAWLSDLENGLQAWEAERLRTGALIHGTAFDPHGPPTPQLVMMIGPKPMSPLPVRAMQQGSPWALGFSDVKPPEASRFFPEPLERADAMVFTEEPVFQEPAPEKGGVDLAGIMAEIEREIPDNIQGAPRQSRIVKELKRRTEVQHASG